MAFFVVRKGILQGVRGEWVHFFLMYSLFVNQHVVKNVGSGLKKILVCLEKSSIFATSIQEIRELFDKLKKPM